MSNPTRKGGTAAADREHADKVFELHAEQSQQKGDLLGSDNAANQEFRRQLRAALPSLMARTTMARSPKVEVGQLFATNGMRFVWRVVRYLPDNVHVVLAQEDEPSRRKTVSAWALLDWGQYEPVTDRKPSG